MKSIGQQILKLPPRAPVMVLPGAHLFPRALLPLYIFEVRYRAMLAWSLEQDRMFCIAAMKPGVTEARTTDEFHHVVGLGLVRACIGRDDGTSHLVLQGLARMRITGFVQDAPFRIATLRELPSRPVPTSEREQLVARLHAACAPLFSAGAKLPSSLEQQFDKIDDPELLIDIVAQGCLHDGEARQAILEETDIARRAALLIAHLRAPGPPLPGEE